MATPIASPIESSNTDDGTAPRVRWRGKWIWPPTTKEQPHAFALFRRCFTLERPSEAARLFITASHAYALWVNGHFVGRGPALSDPRFQRYDERDIAEWLEAGRNCLTVLAHHDISRNRLTAHAEARGLLFQLECGDRVIASDETCRATLATAWRVPPQGFDDTTCAEMFDARQMPADWHTPEFSDGDWFTADPVIPPTNTLWGCAQPQARFYPWVNLIPSEVCEPHAAHRRAKRIHTAGEVLQTMEPGADGAVRLSLETIRPFTKARLDRPETLITGQGEPARVVNSDPAEPDATFDGLRNVTIVLDFGELMNARPVLHLDAPAGAVIDIGYATHLQEGRAVSYRSRRTPQADQYIARAGEQRWQPFQWRQFRYLQLTFRSLNEPLILLGVEAETTEPRLEDRGRFACEDELVNQAMTMSRRTVALTVLDRLMDNASRERRQYLGDGAGMLRAIWALHGDAAVGRKYLHQADEGQHSTGLYRYSYPGHDDDRTSLFDHSLAMPLLVWEHHRLFADAALVERLWPGLIRFARLMTSCLDEDGLMGMPPYAVWLDWAAIDRRGRSFLLSAYAAEAFERLADLSRTLKLGGPAERWSDLAQQIRATLRERFFDGRRGVYVDCLLDKPDADNPPGASEHALSAAIVLGIATPEQTEVMCRTYERDPMAFSQVSPAWQELPTALIRAGRTDLALAWAHRRYGQLIEQGFETIPEMWCLWGEKTLGQWRCRDSRAVAQGTGLPWPKAMLSGVCGLEPAEPGFTRVRLTPRLGSLRRIDAALPGPDGDYAVKMSREGSRLQITLDLPAVKPVELVLPGFQETDQLAALGDVLTPTEWRTLLSGPAAVFQLVGARRYELAWDAGGERVIA
ncbi:family 78 glycoside hydrolase catalytic domain [Phycisphaerales bacterium AB-hyl4]|uniref:Family 78 glycoside hydrolase catalytic domain n=1 Tax=Natronomicrosphaera hydrolytica TaxID=3242702 RepID=A0ABV4U9Q3_9BACT